MSKKSQSKPMHELLSRLERNNRTTLKIIVFPQDTILQVRGHLKLYSINYNSFHQLTNYNLFFQLGPHRKMANLPAPDSIPQYGLSLIKGHFLLEPSPAPFDQPTGAPAPAPRPYKSLPGASPKFHSHSPARCNHSRGLCQRYRVPRQYFHCRSTVPKTVCREAGQRRGP